MYNVEVLSKFPVVQHFPFGSLFSWTPDPSAKTIQASVHTSSQPKASTPSSTAPTPRPQPALRDPMAGISSGIPSTSAPWATTSRNSPSLPPPSTRHPGRLDPHTQSPLRNPNAERTTGMPATTAPWAAGRTTPSVPTSNGPDQSTSAPWAAARTTAPTRNTASAPIETNSPMATPPNESKKAAWASSVPHEPLSEESMMALNERGRVGSLEPNAAPLRKGGEVGLEEDRKQQDKRDA